MRVADRAEPTAAQDPTTKVEPTPLPVPAGPRTGAGRRARARARAAGPDMPTQIAGQLSFEEDEPLRPGEIPPARGERR